MFTLNLIDTIFEKTINLFFIFDYIKDIKKLLFESLSLSLFNSKSKMLTIFVSVLILVSLTQLTVGFNLKRFLVDELLNYKYNGILILL